MSAVEDFVIIDIRLDDRMKEYTAPGYEAYARSLAEEILPKAQSVLRNGNHRRYRMVRGSSLVGVVSFIQCGNTLKYLERLSAYLVRFRIKTILLKGF